MKPTDYECLLACRIVTDFEKQVYSVIQPTTNPYLEKLQSYGWQLVLNADDFEIDPTGFGYRGMCFYHLEKKQLLVAHRGTQFNEVGNVIADLMIMQQHVPKILSQCALGFLEKVYDYNKQIQAELIQTGFSLGGFLAEAGAACTHHLWGKSYSQAICFDSPGSESTLQRLSQTNPHFHQLQDNRQNTIIYVIAPNLVNTAQPHHGKVRQVQIPYASSERLDHLIKKGLSIKFADETLRTEALLLDTVRTHNQNLMRESLSEQQANFKYYEIAQWPLAKNTLEYAASPLSNTVFENWNVFASLYAMLKQYKFGDQIFLLMYDETLQQGVIGLTHQVERSIRYVDSEVALLARAQHLRDAGRSAQSTQRSTIHSLLVVSESSSPFQAPAVLAEVPLEEAQKRSASPGPAP